MKWQVKYLLEARDDLRRLDGGQRILIRKTIEKVSQNPLPIDEDGYGNPSGNKSATNLAGFLKIKLRGAGLRIVYKIVRDESGMLIIVIGARADDEVYEEAQRRIARNNL